MTGMENAAVDKSNEGASLFRLSNCFSFACWRKRIRVRFLLDTSLSSTATSNDSTRHSVTSRIRLNLPHLSDLTFSTRHLNATLEKHKSVEKFNTCVRLFVVRQPDGNPEFFTPYLSDTFFVGSSRSPNLSI
jgi:hypothetical protein